MIGAVIMALIAALDAEANQKSGSSVSPKGAILPPVSSSIAPYLQSGLFTPVTPSTGIGSGYSNPPGSTQIISTTPVTTSTGGTSVISNVAITPSGQTVKTTTVINPGTGGVGGTGAGVNTATGTSPVKVRPGQVVAF
jgi:hypothetical protein